MLGLDIPHSEPVTKIIRAYSRKRQKKEDHETTSSIPLVPLRFQELKGHVSYLSACTVLALLRDGFAEL
jgi:hypothetical protein